VSAIRVHRSPLARLATRWGRAAVQITAANITAQAIGIVTAIYLTYFLSLSQYGRYAIAVFYASMVTHVVNSGLLQGAFMTVFGAGGDDDDDSDDDSSDFLIEDESFDRRRFLFSVLLGTLSIGLLAVALSVVFATPLSIALFRRSTGRELVILAALSGALGAVWRYSVNLLRVERRILSYCICRTTRSVFVFIGVVVLMPTTHGGITAALLALIGGTVASLVIIWAITYRSYRLAARPSDFGLAYRNGLPYIPISLFSGFVHSAGVYLLAGYRGAAEVGRFSVASSMSSVNAHYVSGFLSSFSPIKRTSIYHAVRNDENSQFRGRVINMFAATGLLLYVAIALLAKELIRVSPVRYHSAAALVPYALLGWTGYGFFMVMYRLSDMPRKRVVYVSVSLLSAGLYVGLSALLDPAFGGAGQGAAMGGTYLIVGSIVLFVSQRGPEPLPVDYGRLIVAALLAGACVVGFLRLGAEFPAWRLAIALAGIGVFAAALLAIGLVPWRMVVALKNVVVEIFPRRGTMKDVQHGIEQLPSNQARVLRSLGRPRDPVVQAASLGMSEREFELRAVAGMRELSGLGGPKACDMRIGEYLLSPKSMAERDVLARALRREFDSAEIDTLETTVRLVRKAALRHEKQRFAWLQLALASGRGRARAELPSGPTLALGAGDDARPGLPEGDGEPLGLPAPEDDFPLALPAGGNGGSPGPDGR
jgi:O-antigen/teichoic acid export membrane protein